MGPQTEYANFQEMYEKFLGGSSWYSVENKGGKSLGNHYGQNFVILLKNYDLVTPIIFGQSLRYIVTIEQISTVLPIFGGSMTKSRAFLYSTKNILPRFRSISKKALLILVIPTLLICHCPLLNP